MTKKEYLKKLKKAISTLNKSDSKSIIDYYGEIIDDKIESGYDEEKAVESLESVQSVAERTLEEFGGKKGGRLKKTSEGETRKNKTGRIVVAVCLSPFIALLAICLFVLILALAVGSAAIVFGLSVGGAATFVCGIVEAFTSLPRGLVSIGFGTAASAFGVFAAVALWAAFKRAISKYKDYRRNRREAEI